MGWTPRKGTISGSFCDDDVTLFGSSRLRQEPGSLGSRSELDHRQPRASRVLFSTACERLSEVLSRPLEFEMVSVDRAPRPG